MHSHAKPLSCGCVLHNGTLVFHNHYFCSHFCQSKCINSCLYFLTQEFLITDCGCANNLFNKDIAVNCAGFHNFLDRKVHEANMGPTWVLSVPGGPHVAPMNLAIRDISFQKCITPDRKPVLWHISLNQLWYFLDACDITESSNTQHGISNNLQLGY